MIAGVLASALAMPAGMLTAHMVTHIVIMSLLAPAAALTLLGANAARKRPVYPKLAALLVPATLAQFALFAAAHAPGLVHSLHAPAAKALVALLFFLLSTTFWLSVIASARLGRAASIAALLVTGKSFCLIAALMTFANRSIYGGHAALADQQTAGVIMLIACPLTYVGASVIVVTRWYAALSAPHPAHAGT